MSKEYHSRPVQCEINSCFAVFVEQPLGGFQQLVPPLDRSNTHAGFQVASSPTSGSVCSTACCLHRFMADVHRSRAFAAAGLIQLGIPRVRKVILSSCSPKSLLRSGFRRNMSGPKTESTPLWNRMSRVHKNRSGNFFHSLVMYDARH